MQITVLGTGTVGQVLAERFAELGHAVTMATRDVKTTLARNETDEHGATSFGSWMTEHPQIGLVTLAGSLADADLVVNATSGQASLAALHAAGAGQLEGAVILDVANPLDFSAGFPPTLSVKDTDSLGEQIQAAFPGTRVVKSLNTLAAALMVHPELVGAGEHTVFVSGNDTAAKDLVAQLLRALGHGDVIDLGDITTARGTEMFLALWVRTMTALGTGLFNIRVVR
jgi:predicted dinucleotide-binding enzyme